MTLGEFILNYCSEKDMSYRAFANLVDISPQQISNIIKGIGNNGKPMTSTMKTYRKIASGIGMTEQELLNLLNDDVLVNPSDKKIPATIGDGQLSEYETAVLNANERERNIILKILRLPPEQQDAFLTLTQSVPSNQADQDESKQTE